MFVIVFHLTYRPRRAKGILLTDDLLIGLPTVCKTTVRRTPGYAGAALRRTRAESGAEFGWIKHEPNDLRARFRGPPTSMPGQRTARLQWGRPILGCDLHLGNVSTSSHGGHEEDAVYWGDQSAVCALSSSSTPCLCKEPHICPCHAVTTSCCSNSLYHTRCPGVTPLS